MKEASLRRGRGADQQVTLLHEVDLAGEVWREKEEVWRSVPGVGPVLTTTLFANLPELGTLTRKEVAALAGGAAFPRDSGTLKGRRVIWGRRAHVRAALYMAALVATRRNSVIRAFYQRLCQAGKAKKLALTACMRKLLTILNAMLKHGTPWRAIASQPAWFLRQLLTPNSRYFVSPYYFISRAIPVLSIVQAALIIAVVVGQLPNPTNSLGKQAFNVSNLFDAATLWGLAIGMLQGRLWSAWGLFAYTLAPGFAKLVTLGNESIRRPRSSGG